MSSKTAKLHVIHAINKFQPLKECSIDEDVAAKMLYLLSNYSCAQCFESLGPVSNISYYTEHVH